MSDALPGSIDLKVLDGTLRDLVETIGLEGTIKLCKRHGGTPIRPPRTAESSMHFRKLLGGEATSKMAGRWGDHHYLYVPKADKILDQLRAQEIYREKDEGVPVLQIALRHNLSREWVYEILSRRGRHEPEPQGDLFSTGQ